MLRAASFGICVLVYSMGDVIGKVGVRSLDNHIRRGLEFLEGRGLNRNRVRVYYSS